MAPVGKALVVIGAVLVVIGAAIWRFRSMPIPGRLPGDIYIRHGNFAFYFPITTAIIVSIVLSLIAAWLRR